MTATARTPPRKPEIKVTIIRDDFEDEKSPVTGFIVEDNGIGLDDKNYGSFRRLDSRHKMHRGGKGIGRLGWLKVFSKIKVNSTFQDGETYNRRSFDFQLTETNQIADCPPRAECPAGGGTRVTMQDYTASFMNKCPADPDTILQRLAQHFLNVVVAENPIALMIEDGSLNRNLAKHVLEHVRANNLDPVQLHPEYLVEPLDFVIRHLRISRKFKPIRGFNRMLMFGNDRSANEQNIDNAIGLGMLDDEEVYIGCVSSDFLDKHVNSERTGFTLSEDELIEIRRLLLPQVNGFLQEQVDRIKGQKRKTTQNLIASFPQFLFIRDEMEPFIEALPPGIKSQEDIFLAMARKRYRRQADIRSLGEDINKKGVMNEEIEASVTRYKDMVSLDQKGVLAEYVLRRKSVLDLFDSLQEYKDVEAQKRHREAALHSLICPMGVESVGQDFEDHNLWMVDDQLAFFAYFNSDRQLRSYTDGPSKDRPDLAFFYETCFAWRGEGEASNTVVLIEFKIPGRNNYDGNDNPIRQVSEYVDKLREGNLVSAKGKFSPAKLRGAAYHCYIIADLTSTLRREAGMSPFVETPDGEGLFGFIGNGRAYVEIIPYDKLLRDAKLRQGIFFQKLGLNNLDKPKGTPSLPEERVEEMASEGG